MQKSSRFTRRLRPVARNCGFCHNQTEPNYQDVAALSKFITERGKILARSRTGICSKHQRAITIAIKYARHVALMPFVVRA